MEDDEVKSPRRTHTAEIKAQIVQLFYAGKRKCDITREYEIAPSLLSKKGSPHDNAVAEATFKVIKTELIYKQTFSFLDDLKVALFDYVNWYNNLRIHSSLGCQTPVE
jgi:transposase InsO family protein